MLIRKTIKYKLIPNAHQKEKLFIFLRQYSFVYNGYLKFNQHYHQKNGRNMTSKEMFLLIPKLKVKFNELEGFPSKLFESSIIHLNHELRILDDGDELRQKREHNDTFIVTTAFKFEQDRSRISIPTLRDIKYHNSKIIEGVVKNLAIQEKNGDWFVHVFYEYEKKKINVTAEKFIGIDVGLKEFAILSNGKSITNPRYYRKLEGKLIEEQRKLSRKKRHSKNWEKQRKKVQDIHQNIVNYRMNFLHKISTFIVTHFDVIGIEKLSIQSMVKNRKFSKSILDAGWALFIKMLKYKALEQSKIVIEVERFYPSSQLCSKCGSKQFMPLHLRTFICKSCNHEIDRDYNASKNIENRTRELFKKRA